jgi:mannose-6-phosphate isomerase-like protein (cupin superfamily)
VLVEWEASAERIGPLAPVAPLHVHHEDDEAWYVLEGALGFRLADP